MAMITDLCIFVYFSAPDYRNGNKDNKGIIFFYIATFLHKNKFCDPPLEPSQRDGSNAGSQHMFLLRNKKYYL